MAKQRLRPWAELQREMVSSTARAFGTLYRRFLAASNESYAARGWDGVTMAHVQFLSETAESGTRLSDVASSLGTTKQYVGKLAKDLESKRLVTLVIDPSDRRACSPSRPSAVGRSYRTRAKYARSSKPGFSVGSPRRERWRLWTPSRS